MKGYLLTMAGFLFLGLLVSGLKASMLKPEDGPKWTHVGDVIINTALLVWTLILIAS